MKMERFDVAVIGGGLPGCFAARELSRRKLDSAAAEGARIGSLVGKRLAV